MKKFALIAVAAAVLAGPAQAETIGEDMAVLYYFGRMDVNKDGVVSEAEYRALFMAADTDKSGQVTLQEMMQQKEREKTAMFETMTGKIGNFQLPY